MRHIIYERRALQILVAVLGLVPVGAGLAGALFGVAVLNDVHDALNLDSHFRYLSGLLFGIGLGFWSCIPHIEQKTARCRLLTLIVFIGGLFRLNGAIMHGSPSPGMIFGLDMELAVTPLLCLWQARIAAHRRI